MEPELNSRTFAQLLECLDTDQKRAGKKYEDLRRTLIRFFGWRGAPFPEEHADETFNRLARKLGEGIEIKNIGAYAYEVARLVCLEALKTHAGKRAPPGSDQAPCCTRQFFGGDSREGNAAGLPG